MRDVAEQVKAAGAQIVGFTIDSVFAQKEWAKQLELNFPMVSDLNRDLTHGLGIAREIPPLKFRDVARRSVFVIDRTGTVRYAWAETPGQDETYKIDEILRVARGL